jgi:hypothetical protein
MALRKTPHAIRRVATGWKNGAASQSGEFIFFILHGGF